MQYPTDDISLSTTLYVLVADPNHDSFDYRSLIDLPNLQWGFVETDEVFAAALRLQPWDLIIVDELMLELIPNDLLSAEETVESGHDIFLLVEAEQLEVVADKGLLDLCGYLLKGAGLRQSLSRIIRKRHYLQTLRQERSLLEREIERILKGWEHSVQNRTRNLERKNQELREFDELKNRFLENISHELRAPMTVVRSYVELLMECPPEDESERLEFFEIINAETLRLSKMIDDLLDLTRLSSGNMIWEMKELNLAKLIPKVVSQYHPLLQQAGVSCTVDVPRQAPPVWGDADRLEQVIINLLENCTKHAPQSSVKLRLELMSDTKNNEIQDFAKVTVDDTGPGIPSQQLTRIFSRFARLESNESSQRVRGVGLGLAICREIVQHHKGEMWAEPKEGGARFVFTLPLSGHLHVITGIHDIPSESEPR